MQSNTAAPAKPREAKRSKWKLFSKGTGKSTENLAHEHARSRHSGSSGASEGTSGSRGSYTTEDWKPPVNGQVRPGQPPAQTPSRIMPRQASNHAGRSSKSIPLIKSPMTTAQQPKEVRPAVVATQGGTSMQQDFQPKQKELHPGSALSSSSTPTVRQETYTDPVTGETVTKTITTVLTETTTTQITRPAMSPSHEDEIDMEEERRLAMEYLAENERRAAPGLQAPPRSRGLLGRSRRPSSIPTAEMAGVEVSSKPRRLSASRHSPEYHSSEQYPDHQPAERHSPEKDSPMPKSWTNHSEGRQDSHAADEDYRDHSKPVVTRQKAPPETRIHAQTGYGADMRNDAHKDSRNVQTTYGTNARNDINDDVRNDAHNDARTKASNDTRSDARSNAHNGNRIAQTDHEPDIRNGHQSDSHNDGRNDNRNAQTDHEPDIRNGHQSDSHNNSRNDTSSDVRIKPSSDVRSAARNDNRKYIAPDDDDHGQQNHGSLKSDEPTRVPARREERQSALPAKTEKPTKLPTARNDNRKYIAPDDAGDHGQQNRGSLRSEEPTHVPARREERQGSLPGKTERPTNVPAARKDSGAQSSDDDRNPKPQSRPTSRARSPQAQSQHKLTPPIEEHEPRDAEVSSRRSSWGAVGGGPQRKADTKARDSVVTKVNPLMEHPVKGVNGMNGISKNNGTATHSATDRHNGASETAGAKVMNRDNDVDRNTGVNGKTGMNENHGVKGTNGVSGRRP